MSTVAPIKRAIVQAMRASSSLMAAIAGGINEGIAPRKVRYPFIVYQLVAAPVEHQFDGKQIHALFDISVYAENPVDAMKIMDYYYDPKIATLVAEWVLYMTPVNGVQELIQADAEAAYEKGWTGYAKKLELTANDVMLFPDDELLAQTYNFRDLKTDEERQQWDALFEPIVQ